MTDEQQLLDGFSAWFGRYVAGFYAGDDGHDRNIRLKEEHTARVRDNAVLIARALGLDGRDLMLAETIGLFHDVGRFPQYRQYRTFRDSDSVNHAALGAKVLLDEDALRPLSGEERDIVVRAVALHNVFLLPDSVAGRLRTHAGIVRDADKLDIWRVFIDILGLPEDERPSAAGLGLADVPACSPGVLAQLHRREMVTLDSLRSLNDFKVLQLAWIYDLNTLPALRLAKERDVIGRLSATLPRDSGIDRALDAVRAYVDERLARGR